MSIETEVETPPEITIPPPDVLPLLRERAVYVRDNGAGVDDSDFINKSFKGILRLSPNDSSSYLEMDNYVTYDDVTDEFISFEDSVANQLGKQFIKVSTSDGYLLDLRISTTGIEYDNLYVLGAVKVNQGSTGGSLQLYAEDNKSFKFGKSHIISDYNKNASVSSETPDMASFNPIDDKNINEAYVLLTTQNGDMEFANINDIVELFVKSALMELSAVPSGSIHAIPVNLYQYNLLMKKARDNNLGHNISIEGNDPIIRDYLICDGSYYRAKDFPELAKVLYKEKIFYHKNKVKYDIKTASQVIEYSEFVCDEIKDDNENVLPNENNFEKTIVVDPNGDLDDDSRYETVKVFRVPDLRGMFMQFVVPGLADAHNNPTGVYEKDSIKSNDLMIKRSFDHHYHYIVLDSPKNRVNSKSGNQAEITKNGGNGELATLLGNKPAALTRYGAIGKVSGSGRYYEPSKPNSCCTMCSWDGFSAGMGLGPIYPPDKVNDFRCYSIGPSGGYILSTVTPKESEKMLKSDWVGSTSWTIDMTVPRDNYAYDIDRYLNYTKDTSDPIYKGNNIKYASYNSEEMKNLLGHENTPEFYAILPLIKI